MKKLLSYFLVAALTVTTCMMGALPVSAASKTGSKSGGNSAVKWEKKSSKETTYKEGEALVLFKSSGVSTKSAAKSALSMGDTVQVKEVWDFDTASDESGSPARKKSGGTTLNIALVKSKTLKTKDLITKLKKQKNVQLAEPNYRIKATDVSNDTYSNQQWALDNTGQNRGTKESSTNVKSKWDKGIKGSDKAVVAIVDSGVDYTHEDLKNNMWENTYQPDLRGEYGFDFVNGDTDPIDDNGHGSHCAGIIGAEGDNNIGISGINQKVKIMALKFLDSQGSGWGSGAIGAYHYINKALDLGVNVVAINNSWGGVEESEIFSKLTDIVGAKGAVSVCAAGNEENNNDEYSDYPSGIESQYKLSVAASNEKNELATFSNYGKNSVDLAAPGVDVLSTVSYNCYNPTLYNAEKQAEISQKFNDYEGTDKWGIPDQSTFSSSANTSSADVYAAAIESADSFGIKDGKSLKLTFKGLKAGEGVAVRIPYTLPENFDEETAPNFSAMAKAAGPESTMEEAAFLVADVAKGTSINSLDDLMEDDVAAYSGVYVSGEANYWEHLTFPCGTYEAETAKKDREIVFLMQAEKAGDYTVCLDDMGLSKDGLDQSKLGKYDFYNGTSMAAPYVTGAVALAAAEAPSASSDERINMVLSTVKTEKSLKDKVNSGGVLDLRQSVKPGPRIGSISVNTAKNQIVIKGSGFGDNVSSVKINDTEAKIVSKTNNQLVIENNGWINTVADLTITGAEGKTATKKEVYLVKGKADYTPIGYLEFSGNDEPLTTDGRFIYSAESGSDSINMADTADGKYMEFDTAVTVNPNKFFKKDSGSVADYDFTFGKDLVYMDSKLYSVGAYSQAIPKTDEGGDDDWSYGDYEDEEKEGSGSGATIAFSSQYKLFAMDPNTEKTVCLGNLPSDVKKAEDWTLAAYNGNLYLIGGYDFGKKAISKTVKIYNPTTKKWSNGPSLPEGRAGGKALQVGNSLVYTLGYGSSQANADIDKQECPKNLILSGGKWKTSSKTIEPYTAETVGRSGHDYNIYSGTVGLCSGGLVYAGIPAAKLGDTFTYNVSKDSYAGTNYNKITDLFYGEESFSGVAVGSSLYGYDQEGDSYRIGISSGLVKVTAPKMNGGSISGANRGYAPGNKITLKAKAKSGYYVKSFKVNGKTVKGNTKAIRLISNQKATASFGRYVSKIKLNKKKVTVKAGKSFKLKAKISPSNASSKKVTYKSSNKKYATVTSKGVIKANKAGIGKTVKITVKAKDGSKKKAVCTVTIKR